jgi:leucyl aminopeptidase (aminopeptidase T)
MANTVSLEQVETLAAQLPPQEQLKLVARISERLTEVGSRPVTVSKREAERLRKERAREAAAILRECDRAAVAFTRQTDSAETIRRIRSAARL